MRIGILEDDPALSRILQLCLKVAGHTVYPFQVTEDFLSFIASSPLVDLIIVDFRLMSDISGIEFIHRIRMSFPNLPAILISAAPLTTLQAATVGLSRVKVLSKPFP